MFRDKKRTIKKRRGITSQFEILTRPHNCRKTSF